MENDGALAERINIVIELVMEISNRIVDTPVVADQSFRLGNAPGEQVVGTVIPHARVAGTLSDHNYLFSIWSRNSAREIPDRQQGAGVDLPGAKGRLTLSVEMAADDAIMGSSVLCLPYKPEATAFIRADEEIIGVPTLE